MPLDLALLMAATAALLAVAVCGVLWGGRKDVPPAVELPKAVATLPAMPAAAPEPEGTLHASQVEVGQTFHLQTATAKYVLTLRDPESALYDAVRIGRKRKGGVVTERFQMLFKGTFVAYQGLRHREFVPGGNLCYRKIRDGRLLDMTPSSTILRILFTVGEPLRQAS